MELLTNSGSPERRKSKKKHNNPPLDTTLNTWIICTVKFINSLYLNFYSDTAIDLSNHPRPIYLV